MRPRRLQEAPLVAGLDPRPEPSLGCPPISHPWSLGQLVV